MIFTKMEKMVVEMRK